jgi:hypothetical protein
MTVYKKQMSFEDIEENEEYRNFVEKFKPKKTTDDCYTPENIYDAVAEFVESEYGRKRSGFVRPFWPGGDFESFDYPSGCTVVDNPPFSITSKILEFYDRHDIPFFIFANGLTLFTAPHLKRLTYICAGTSIEYQNGAKVCTGFITNMSPEICIRSCPELHDAIEKCNKTNCKKTKKEKRKLEFPDAFITAARCNWLSTHHTRFMIRRKDSVYLSGLESIGGVFGGGYLLSERAAAERAAAERAAAERAAAERAERADLSEMELAVQKSISMQEVE